MIPAESAAVSNFLAAANIIQLLPAYLRYVYTSKYSSIRYSVRTVHTYLTQKYGYVRPGRVQQLEYSEQLEEPMPQRRDRLPDRRPHVDLLREGDPEWAKDVRASVPGHSRSRGGCVVAVLELYGCAV